MASPPSPVRHITQFARQAQYLSERANPIYSPLFKATMRYVPLAMRLYRFKHYWDMEQDYAGFDIESGRAIRQALASENEAYVKATAPQKYWDALIPRTEIGCKRKVLDTEYLKSLWQENVELVSEDPVERISEMGVVTRSGREVRADAVVLAIGFATQQMLCPMEIRGRGGVRLNEFVSPATLVDPWGEAEYVLTNTQWDKETQGVAQAYFGTVVPNFPNVRPVPFNPSSYIHIPGRHVAKPR
jgi:cation diffusion facilitator CzcD-associated flavoprotein CzcO